MAHVGNFCETKKVTLGRGSKANHLTYLGDAVIGSGVNVGAGVITCNYDGAKKHTTTIGDGSSSAPTARWLRRSASGRAYVGAGSCITHPFRRSCHRPRRQVTKEGWVAARRAARAAARDADQSGTQSPPKLAKKRSSPSPPGDVMPRAALPIDTTYPLAAATVA